MTTKCSYTVAQSEDSRSQGDLARAISESLRDLAGASRGEFDYPPTLPLALAQQTSADMLAAMEASVLDVEAARARWGDGAAQEHAKPVAGPTLVPLPGAFAALLEGLGFEVRRLGAAVIRRGPNDVIDHLTLEVSAPGTGGFAPHLVDVGFGDSFCRQDAA